MQEKNIIIVHYQPIFCTGDFLKKKYQNQPPSSKNPSCLRPFFLQDKKLPFVWNLLELWPGDFSGETGEAALAKRPWPPPQPEGSSGGHGSSSKSSSARLGIFTSPTCDLKHSRKVWVGLFSKTARDDFCLQKTIKC